MVLSFGVADPSLMLFVPFSSDVEGMEDSLNVPALLSSIDGAVLSCARVIGPYLNYVREWHDCIHMPLLNVHYTASEYKLNRAKIWNTW